ncbi:hypothetical protein EV702DRAFT_1126519 [Suillus placidus]|uniref:Uncharacterized protein n=1 Tax=Suillus placidus TaxID=48579 RepID=A0A9P7CZV4_9AGAM|nr:hypothetical protein EV702DRAFT_1126519 [Suillus placidus]
MSTTDQPVRRKHAHMHTRNNGGIDTDLATGLDANFAWIPPLESQSQVDDGLEGPESLTEDEVAAAFGYEILAGKVYDLAELEQVPGSTVHKGINSVGLLSLTSCALPPPDASLVTKSTSI